MKVKCKVCQGILDVDAELHGKEVMCGHCKKVFIAIDPKRAALEKKVQKKKEAKAKALEAKRQEHVKKESIKAASELQELQSQRDRKSLENYKAAQHERRKNELSQTSFDIANHDWSIGGPFVYQCVELGTLSQDWQGQLGNAINTMAEDGWEYYRAESLTAQRPNGCLAAFFGNGTTEYSVVVLVFRKPTRLKIYEQSS